MSEASAVGATNTDDTVAAAGLVEPVRISTTVRMLSGCQKRGGQPGSARPTTYSSHPDHASALEPAVRAARHQYPARPFLGSWEDPT